MLSGFVLASAFALASIAQAPPSNQNQEGALAAWKAISSTSSMIDACTEAYTAEYPNNAGTARIQATVGKDGTVEKAVVTTTLEGSRNLPPCLERVAKSWKLPATGGEASTPLSLTVQVRKGVKFVLKKPGEKAQAPKQPGQPQEETVVDFNFLPGSWTENPQ